MRAPAPHLGGVQVDPKRRVEENVRKAGLGLKQAIEAVLIGASWQRCRPNAGAPLQYRPKAPHWQRGSYHPEKFEMPAPDTTLDPIS